MTDTNNEIISNIDERGVATITLNRPDLHNAFNETMIARLTELFVEYDANPKVKIVVIRATGANFCAGADLRWMKTMSQYSQTENLNDAKALGNMLQRLYEIKKPTLALVHGASFGGGIGLIACCQMAIASTNANFCFSEVRLGLVPAVISPYVIQAIGIRNARAYFLTAQSFTSKDAFRMGLCQAVVAPEELINAGNTVVDLMLQNGPQALQAVNRLLADLQPMPVTYEIREITAKTIAQLRVSEEGQEGLNAFLNKRKPNWIK